MQIETLNKSVVRRFIEEVINGGELASLPKLVSSPDGRESVESRTQPGSLDTLRTQILRVRQAYPDLRITIEQQVAEGDWVATRITAQGTPSRTPGIPLPPGRALAISGINLDRIQHGQIVEHGGTTHMLEALLAMASALPTPHTPISPAL